MSPMRTSYVRPACLALAFVATAVPASAQTWIYEPDSPRARVYEPRYEPRYYEPRAYEPPTYESRAYEPAVSAPPLALTPPSAPRSIARSYRRGADASRSCASES
jgi:hypothetical protein